MIGSGRSSAVNAAPQISMFKSESSANKNDAALMKKHFGNKNLGEILNKVADPNAAQKSPQRNVNNKMGKDAFLKLLLTQLKNQDPMSPMESHDMSAQLAQFSSLEKLEGIDKGINKLSQSTDKNSSYDSLNLIGKMVSGDATKIVRDQVGQSHDINFEISSPMKQGKLEVLNQVGEVVHSEDIGALDKGKHKLTWNGVGATGVDAATGDYNVAIAAIDGEGKSLPVKTEFTGQVTGVNFTSKGPIILVGKKAIPLNEIKKIEIPQMNNRKGRVQTAPRQPANVQPMGGAQGQTRPVTVVPQASERLNPSRQMSTQMSLSKGPLSKATMSPEVINKINESLKK